MTLTPRDRHPDPFVADLPNGRSIVQQILYPRSVIAFYFYGVVTGGLLALLLPLGVELIKVLPSLVG